ncbi:DUF975 family protein [Leuconostoc suionicum]|uniref:DUF975 family protein n=1 Tax=Leuconostoc suionicum TaxID=1511761 RepID=UPI00233E6276|nr:DUF975 family protein [Leuconostoc suionicum]MDC2805709.1 DUF975 family protein [Leuconostoc suionicum]MDC2823221.1 DUF975 family protein [Leuconostoc suionicum]
MNQEPISIIDVKRDAKKFIKGRLGTAIKINIIAIIVTVMTLSMMTFAVYAMIKDTNLMSSADVSSTTTSLNMNTGDVIVSVLRDAAGLTFMWSVSWTIIDWFNKPEKNPRFIQTFQIFNNGKFPQSLLLAVVQSMLTFLWTMLFTIPGLIKHYSYAQTYFSYKLDLDAGKQANALTDYITRSRKIMNGRKWELFLLDLSFIGWHLLGILTAGLAYIYVIPYLNATKVAYSRRLFKLNNEANEEQ